MSIFPLLLLIGFGLWASSVARKKNRNSMTWFLLGVAASFLAVILIYNLPPNIIPGKTKRCLQCLDVSEVHLDYCQSCGARFSEGLVWDERQSSLSAQGRNS